MFSCARKKMSRSDIDLIVKLLHKQVPIY